MIDLEQMVHTTWNNMTKKWYEEKGYEFTKTRNPLVVKAKDLPLNSTVKVDVICDYCGKQKQISYKDYLIHTKNNTIKYACSKCNGKKFKDLYGDKIRQRQYERFINACNERGYIPVSNYEDYIDSKSRMEFICPKHGIKNVEYNTFINSKFGCAQCGYDEASEKLKKSVDEILEIVSNKNNNVLLNPKDYINFSTNNLRILCGSCGNIFTTSLSSIVNSGGRCIECGVIYNTSLQLLSKEEVEMRINSVNDNVLLNPEDYVGNSVNNLEIQCKCGNIYHTSLANFEYNQTNRCGACSQRTSKGELQIMKFLDFYKIPYEVEYKFDDCKDIKPLPFDFYLQQFNCCIEFDGQHHFYPIYDNESYYRTIRHDQIKNEYCFNNGIRLIRIPYWEGNQIDKILKQELNLPDIKLINIKCN